MMAELWYMNCGWLCISYTNLLPPISEKLRLSEFTGCSAMFGWVMLETITENCCQAFMSLCHMDRLIAVNRGNVTFSI